MTQHIHEHVSFIDLLAGSHELYQDIADIEHAAEQLSKSLPMPGQHLINRAGRGNDFFQIRAQKHPSERISAMHSMRFQEEAMVIDQRHEQKQHLLLWPDSREPARRPANQMLILAAAIKLASQEDNVNIWHDGRKHRIGRNAYKNANQLDVTLISDETPEFHRMPLRSKAILCGDFYDHAETEAMIDDLAHRKMSASFIFTLTPEEAAFEYLGNNEIYGQEGLVTAAGDPTIQFQNAAQMRNTWFKALHEHLAWLQDICSEHGFSVYRQNTDELMEFRDGKFQLAETPTSAALINLMENEPPLDLAAGLPQPG